MRKNLFVLLLIGWMVTNGFVNAQNPVNPNASPEARALLQFLYQKKGNGIVTANHNEQESPTGWDDALKAKNGNVEPAMWGNDFRYGSYVQYRQRWIDEAKRQWQNKGKIITIMYHQVRPMDNESTGSFAGSVQGELTFTEFEGLLTDGNSIHEAWKSKMDDIAGYLQQLEDANIPVLFRPYHEMNGEWFWWGGKSGSDQYKRLYRMTYDYLTNTKGLNNLLWVLNFDDLNSNFSAYYPGDGYVDAFATDIYNASFSTAHYNALKTFANGRPIAIGEVGDMISMDQIRSTYPDYVWIMGWRDLFVNNNSSSTLTTMYSHSWAINTYTPGTPPPACIAQTIPGTIEAENYCTMSGIQTQATTDTGGGENVGWIDSGDFMEYKISVPASGNYAVSFRVASSANNIQFDLKKGSTVLTSVNEPTTGGWQTWTTVTKTVALTSGENTITIAATGSGWNFNWMSFASGSSGSSLPYNENFDSLGGTFEVTGSVTKTWSSPVINIAAGPVDISMDLTEGGSLDAGGSYGDYLNVYYRINGGSNIVIREISGASGLTALGVSNISGSTLQILFEGHTSASDELYQIDNLSVALDQSQQVVTQTLNPNADSYTEESLPSTNNGTKTYLEIKGDQGTYDREAFLKFDISSFGSISNAKLRLYCSSNDGGTVDHSIFGVTNDSWSESGITWSNAPTVSTAALATTNVSTTGQYYEWNITSFVANQTDGIVSLKLANEGDDMVKVRFDSRESANKPELIVTGSPSLKSAQIVSKTDQLFDTDYFKIYPNPSISGNFNVSVKNYDEVSSLFIYTMDGRMVFNEPLSRTSGEKSIDANLLKGMYLVVLKTKDTSITQKLIVQ